VIVRLLIMSEKFGEETREGDAPKNKAHPQV